MQDTLVVKIPNFPKNYKSKFFITDEFMYPHIFYAFIIIGSISQFFFWICFACCIGDQRQSVNQVIEVPTVSIIKDDPPTYEEALNFPKPTKSELPRY